MFIPKKHSGFTLVELLIGMTIFAIGLTGIYALLSSTINNATYSRQEIIAVNLMREKMELIKNLRDTNIQNFIPWDSAIIEKNGETSQRLYSGTFLIENNFDNSRLEIDPNSGKILRSPVFIKEFQITSTSTGDIWENARLYRDNEGRYTYTLTNTGTPYALITKLSPIFYKDDKNLHYIVDVEGNPDGYIIETLLYIKTSRSYRLYDAKSAITNWIR